MISVLGHTHHHLYHHFTIAYKCKLGQPAGTFLTKHLLFQFPFMKYSCKEISQKLEHWFHIFFVYSKLFIATSICEVFLLSHVYPRTPALTDDLYLTKNFSLKPKPHHSIMWCTVLYGRVCNLKINYYILIPHNCGIFILVYIPLLYLLWNQRNNNCLHRNIGFSIHETQNLKNFMLYTKDWYIYT